MATNQYVNKVVFGNTTLIDITQDSVTANTLLSGYTAHSATGASIIGSIATKTGSDITLTNNVLAVPTGYYNNVEKTLTSVELTVPESGTNSFDVIFPDGEDTLTLSFSVDDEGNCDITNETMNLI